MNEATKVSEWHIDDGFIKNDKKTVHIIGKLRELKAERLINTTANAVAANGGLEDLFRDDNTKTLVVMGIGGVD